MGRNVEQAGLERAAALARGVMDARGLTAVEVSRATELDQGTVGDFVNGHRWPIRRTRARLEEFLGLDAGAFQRAYDDTESSEPSDPSPVSVGTLSVSDNVLTGGLNVVTVKARAIGVELTSTYADAEDRPRALEHITRAMVELMRANEGGSGASGDDPPD